MKKIAYLVLLITLSTACKKDHTNSPSGPEGYITGKWNYLSVSTVARDSTGKNIIMQRVYTNEQGSYFQFNTDHTWIQNLTIDSLNIVGSAGEYQVNSATSLTLSIPGANAVNEVCKIYTLTSTNFVFSHSRSAVFNGTSHGSIEYIYTLTK